MKHIVNTGLSAQENLLALVSAANAATLQKPLTADDVVFGKPSDSGTGEVDTNTVVTMSAKAGFDHAGSVTLRYRRYALSDRMDGTLSHAIGKVSTKTDIVAALAAHYGMIADELHIPVELPDPTKVNHGDQVSLRIEAVDGSFTYLKSYIDHLFTWIEPSLGDLIKNLELSGFESAAVSTGIDAVINSYFETYYNGSYVNKSAAGEDITVFFPVEPTFAERAGIKGMRIGNGNTPYLQFHNADQVAKMNQFSTIDLSILIEPETLDSRLYTDGQGLLFIYQLNGVGLAYDFNKKHFVYSTGYESNQIVFVTDDYSTFHRSFDWQLDGSVVNIKVVRRTNALLIYVNGVLVQDIWFDDLIPFFVSCERGAQVTGQNVLLLSNPVFLTALLLSAKIDGYDYIMAWTSIDFSNGIKNRGFLTKQTELTGFSKDQIVSYQGRSTYRVSGTPFGVSINDPDLTDVMNTENIFAMELALDLPNASPAFVSEHNGLVHLMRSGTGVGLAYSTIDKKFVVTDNGNPVKELSGSYNLPIEWPTDGKLVTLSFGVHGGDVYVKLGPKGSIGSCYLRRNVDPKVFAEIVDGLKPEHVVSGPHAQGLDIYVASFEILERYYFDRRVSQ